MRIETYDEYLLAGDRLKALGQISADGTGQDEFLDLTAAMLDFETREHPALSKQPQAMEGGDG
ncbi:hypothetical protein [Bosea sp. BK604]|uniref:hypothetical protein n=1 Tax=Bosea sp. BK604 TaxID=2512180 RepID=UPI001042C99F|nr:hypothetical protein [Bosea sp. BK604]